MVAERGEDSRGQAAARSLKPAGLLGSLKDALRAAGRDDAFQTPLHTIEVRAASGPAEDPAPSRRLAPSPPIPPLPMLKASMSNDDNRREISMSAAEAARLARTPAGVEQPAPGERKVEAAAPVVPVAVASAEPPTTRVLRAEASPRPSIEAASTPRTQLLRGRQPIARATFAQDPVVGFLIVVGGPGLGSSRPIFEGNNTVGRAKTNRIPLDFGDETISLEAQAFLRYDAHDRSFLFVPNLAKTNVVSVNDTRPTGAVELKAMDVVTFGRTQVAFLPFCGPEFDWSEISDAKDE